MSAKWRPFCLGLNVLNDQTQSFLGSRLKEAIGEKQLIFTWTENTLNSQSYGLHHAYSVTWRDKRSWDPFYKHGLTLTTVWITNFIHHNVWDEITFPYPKSNGATIEVHSYF